MRGAESTVEVRAGGRRATLAAMVIIAAGALSLPATAWGDDPAATLEVWPPHFELVGPRATLRPVITRIASDGATRDVTLEAALETSSADVCRVEDGVLRAAGDGEARVTARVGELSASIVVRVRDASASAPVSFEREVLAVLSKQGCSSGPCHGSPGGKGGFRLSLRGFDAAFDARTVLREAFGRRVDRIDPPASLLLAKPSTRVTHGGGLRLEPDSAEWRTLETWIREGAHGPSGAPPLAGIDVYPRDARVLRGDDWTQQLSVIARFEDGSSADVTALSVFTISAPDVARVEASGRVEGRVRGDATVLVRYLDALETCSFTFVRPVEGFAWSEPPPASPVDRLLESKLRLLALPPSEPVTDDEFLRRVWLDLTGRLPPRAEVERFLASEDPARREELVDAVLASEDFARHQALRLGDVLRLQPKSMTAAGSEKFNEWLVRAIETNAPHDRLVRAILDARGSTRDVPPASWWVASSGADDAAEAAAQVFLGTRIQCARCHNHPFERWSQDDYWGLVAVFERVRVKDGPGPGERVVFDARDGETRHPRTNEVVRPSVLVTGPIEPGPIEPGPGADGATGDVPDGVGPRTRREAFTEWLTDPSNPFFARVEVNRIWASLFGRGIVHPIDDFRDSNPPSHPELLDWLAEEFVRSGYDRRHIFRLLLTSRAYQRSARGSELNAADERYFSRGVPRLLEAEKLLDAIAHVTGVAEKFRGRPAGLPASQLPSPADDNDFLEVFGQPERVTVCACERPEGSNLSQALRLFNGPLVHAKLRHSENRFRRALREGLEPRAIVADIWYAAYCRPPRAEEVERALAWIESRGDVEAGLEDITWAVLNSKEFLFR